MVAKRTRRRDCVLFTTTIAACRLQLVAGDHCVWCWIVGFGVRVVMATQRYFAVAFCTLSFIFRRIYGVTGPVSLATPAPQDITLTDSLVTVLKKQGIVSFPLISLFLTFSQVFTRLPKEKKSEKVS